MNGSNVILDTNIVLYFLEGDQTLSPLFEENILYLSFITELELLGYNKLSGNDADIIESFIYEQCTIVDISEEIKKNTIILKRKYNLKLPDTIILATSMYLNFPVISADKDLYKVKEANVIFYEK